MPIRLKSITLKGYKSIREVEGFEAKPLNILIGSNGAGKSNFIAFFRLLNWMLGGGGKLQEYVALNGGAGKLLFDGVGKTTRMTAALRIEAETGLNEYEFTLAHSAGDRFIFVDERYRYSAFDYVGPLACWNELEAGHREPLIIQEAEGGNRTASAILSMLRRCVVFQFHNTSETSRLRQKWKKSDSRYLKEDGANLAPFLFRLRNNHPEYYRKILNILRSILPFFSDFVLEPEYDSFLLQWLEKGSDEVFSVDQASDGMLRTMALVALLAQPLDEMPDILIFDEPELGLHPYAIETIAGLIKTAAMEKQVFVATQSGAFVDYFDPEDIVVVEREPGGRGSVYNRKTEEELGAWLQDYSMSELWEKNILGGTP